MDLQTVGVLVGVAVGGGGIVHGLWRVTGAAHRLVQAVDQNTAATRKLSDRVDKFRRRTRRRLDEHDERLTRLEGGNDPQE